MALSKEEIAKRIEQNQILIHEILSGSENCPQNPLINICKNAKPRPWTVDDFKKKVFITNLIGKE